MNASDQSQYTDRSRPDEPTSYRVVTAVAERTGTETDELPRLYDHVDPDALNSLVEGSDDLTVSFSFAGCEVAVFGDGTVRVTE